MNASFDARQTGAEQEGAEQEGAEQTDAERTAAKQDGAERTGEARPAASGWLRSTSKIVVFYIAVPLAVYYLLRSAGLNAVTALLLGGVLPAGGVAIGAIRHRRLDVVGALVVAGILVGAVLGLISHSARLVLIEGSVPTGVFGVSCLGSLRTRRPLMYGMALEFAGPDSAQGREMTRLWQYEGYQRVFWTITAVWGVGFLLEAALRVVIVYSTSAGTALAISKIMPWIWVGALSAWTVAYGKYRKRKGEGMVLLSERLPLNYLPAARLHAARWRPRRASSPDTTRRSSGTGRPG